MFKFKEYREKAGLTQKEAASAFGVSIQSVSNWETGTRRPSLEQLCAIADQYNVSTDQLLGRDNVKVTINAGSAPVDPGEGIARLVIKDRTPAPDTAAVQTTKAFDRKLNAMIEEALKKRGF